MVASGSAGLAEEPLGSWWVGLGGWGLGEPGSSWTKGVGRQGSLLTRVLVRQGLGRQRSW